MSVPLKILVIEDSADDAELLVNALRSAGFDPTATRVQDEPGFKAELSGGADLIISDYKLPLFSPQQALEILKKSGLETPVIIVSGTIGEEAAVACMRAGAWDYLLKDRLGRLGAAVANALERKRMLHEKSVELAQRRRREILLQVQYDVVRILTDTRTAEEPVREVLEVLSSKLGFELAEFWELGPNNNIFTCSAVCMAPELQAQGSLENLGNRFYKGARLIADPPSLSPGVWIADLSQVDFPRSAQLAGLGFRTAFAIPLETSRALLGLITLYSRNTKEFDAESVDVLKDLGARIGNFVERCQLEQQLRQAQRMECIGQLAGGIAHDFNNLLTIMHGHLGAILAHPKLPSDLKEPSEEVSLAVEKASGLTQQLLAFSRKQVFHMAPLDLDRVAENMSRMLRRLLGEQIALSITRQEKAPGSFIQADAGMIEQILLNLAVNARDAMPNGGKLMIHTSCVSIGPNYLDSHQGAALGEHVCLSVADTGTGIPPEAAPHIFEPFFTTKAPGKGTGLGLATVYGIVREHGGWISFYSEVNKGTLFRVYFPRLETAPPPEAAPAQTSVQRQGHETILLVEDEPALRALIRKVLKNQGYRVLEANSGVAALQVWSQHRDEIDLLLTDMVMPEGLTGRDLAEKLLRERPGLRIIFSSGYSPEMVESQLDFEPGQSFLQKPYSPQQLASALRQAFES